MNYISGYTRPLYPPAESMEAHAVTTVICPQCHAELDVAAVVCYECGTATNDEPQSTSGLPDEGRLLDRPWFVIVLLLHVGVLGIPAYWMTKYSLGTRLAIVAASIAYTVFAVVVIVWGLTQIARLFNM